MLRVLDEKVIFNVFEAMKQPLKQEEYLSINFIDSLVKGVF